VNDIAITNPDGTYKLSIPCPSCRQQAELQQHDGWYWCPWCRGWLRAADGKAEVVKGKKAEEAK
jgi:Zn finger protein HypA/HybF involved in hydrogenase expression